VNPETTRTVFETERLLAIGRFTNRETALGATQALREAGFQLIEITLSFEEWPSVLEELASWPEVTPGVGTVMTPEDARLALSLGARYIVSPHTDAEVIRIARDGGALAIPGAATPTEIATAWRLGADLIKLFPAPILGGPEYLRVLKGPLPEVRYLVTGNVKPETIQEYLETGVVLAAGLGSPVLPPESVANQDWNTVQKTAKAVKQQIKKLSIHQKTRT
jgi:2-dehydro-3-deoxyphosphogluconate aldolase/(4S)-4-hydroxy-2-oxoglutarate aldolase